MTKSPDKRGLIQLLHSACRVRDSFWSPSNRARILFSLLAVTLFVPVTQAQSTPGNLQNILHEKATLDPSDLAALQQGEPAVTLLPANHKQEVAVYGLVRVQASAEMFLQSFRDTMATRSNSAILEIGRFGTVPSLDDLNTLTLESRDLEDLKKCVVGNCELKLSAKMIDQFQKTVDSQSSDYAGQATQAYKLMLLDYVRDYLTRGDQALIEYADKSKPANLLEGQGVLLNSLPGFFQTARNGSSFRAIENAIVWSKIKFGLKPVLAINHIAIFRSEQELGPQILILSKQIYANHYFDASVALTGVVRNPSGNHGHYLFYENHSLADGLQGLFSKFKRKMIERQAADGLKDVLRGTKMGLDARAINESEAARPPQTSSWNRLKLSSKQRLLLLCCVTALVMLALATYARKGSIPPRHAG